MRSTGPSCTPRRRARSTWRRRATPTTTWTPTRSSTPAAPTTHAGGADRRPARVLRRADTAAGCGHGQLDGRAEPQVVLLDVRQGRHRHRGAGRRPALPDTGHASKNGRILSTLPNGEYGFLQGTSMASPHAAGVAALLKSTHPKARPAQLQALLKAQANATACPESYDQDGDGTQDAVCKGGKQINGFYGLRHRQRAARGEVTRTRVGSPGTTRTDRFVPRTNWRRLHHDRAPPALSARDRRSRSEWPWRRPWRSCRHHGVRGRRARHPGRRDRRRERHPRLGDGADATGAQLRRQRPPRARPFRADEEGHRRGRRHDRDVVQHGSA